MWHIGRNLWEFFHTEYFKIIHVLLSALLYCPVQSKATHFWSVPVWEQMALAKQWLCGQLSMGHTQDHCLAERSVWGQIWASWGGGEYQGDNGQSYQSYDVLFTLLVDLAKKLNFALICILIQSKCSVFSWATVLVSRFSNNTAVPVFFIFFLFFLNIYSLFVHLHEGWQSFWSVPYALWANDNLSI